MAATAKRKNTGQSGEYSKSSNKQQEPYIVFDAADEADAVGTAYTEAPATITTNAGVVLYKGAASWELLAEAADGSTQTYEVVINYETVVNTPAPEGTVRIAYTTQGGTATRTQAIQEVSVYPTDTAPSYGGAVRATADKAEGTDVPVPIFHLTVSKIFAIADLPDPNDVFQLTSSTNDADFTVTDSITGQSLTFLPGEAQFMGGRQSEPRADGMVELQCEFDCSPNLTNITIGDITSIEKFGHEYLWVRYEGKTIGEGDDMVQTQVPKHVIIDRMFELGNFSLLNL